MKVLFISNFFDGTGYSQAAIDWALALDTVGVDVVVRNIKLNQNVVMPPERILELQDKDDRNCDFVIQYTLPHLMSYNRAAGVNVAMFDYETSNFRSSSWDDKLRAMDYIFVPNMEQIDTCINSGLDHNKIRRVSHACDISRYQQKINPLQFDILNGKFVFYFIGEFTRRKDFGSLIKAFHTEFDMDEQVELLLKTSVSGKNSLESLEIIRGFCSDIKAGIKKYGKAESYKKEMIITDRLSDIDLLRLHKTCNCFVATSHGEGWCQPAMDALGVGNPVLGSYTGGLREFIYNEKNGILLNGVLDRCFGAIDTFGDLYTSDEVWFNVNVDELCFQMRNIYNKSKNGAKPYEKEAMKTPYKYSYEVVGKQMKEMLLQIK